jgi:hypothetical protein
MCVCMCVLAYEKYSDSWEVHGHLIAVHLSYILLTTPRRVWPA